MIAEAKTALESVKLIGNVAKSFGNLDLQQRAVDLQLQVMELVDRLDEAREEARQLRETLQLRGELTFADNAYWRGAERTEANGPFCAPCFDGSHKLVHLLYVDADTPQCPVCKTYVQLDGRRRGPSHPQVAFIERRDRYDGF